MPYYTIEARVLYAGHLPQWLRFTVEADSEEEALEALHREAPRVLAHRQPKRKVLAHRKAKSNSGWRKRGWRTERGQRAPQVGERPSAHDYLVEVSREGGEFYADVFDKFGRLVFSTLGFHSSRELDDHVAERLSHQLQRRLRRY